MCMSVYKYRRAPIHICIYAGSRNFLGRVPYAASHVDLWMGADWTLQQCQELRALNPRTLILSSINAVEGFTHDDIPEAYYLHNISGQGPNDRWRIASMHR